MSTRTIARLIFSSSKYLWHRNVILPWISLRHFTILTPWKSFWRYSPSETYVSRAVTEQWLSRKVAGCFKMAKKWPSLTFLPHLLIRKATFQWVNLLESKKISKKMEPLGLKYLLLVRLEIGSAFTITAGVSWKFLNFHGVLQRFPSITQANSQVCFRWMSNCVI